MRSLLIIISFLISKIGYSDNRNVDNYNTEIKNGPNLIIPCPAPDKSFESTDEMPEEENEDTLSVLSIEIRNDYLASPFMALKNRHFFVWDMGETHGGKIEGGFSNSRWGELTLKYKTRLFAEQDVEASEKRYVETLRMNEFRPLEKNQYFRVQDFTSEQIYTIAYRSPQTKNGFNFYVELGLIQYESKDDRNFLNASTQQRLYHNSDEDLTNVENLNSHSEINGVGFVLIPKIEKTFDTGKGFILTPYFQAKLSSISAANNATFGLNGEFNFKHPHDFFSRIKFDIPITFYKDYLKNRAGIFTRPSLSVSLGYGLARLGFRYDVPFGNWQENIPQNVKTINTDDIVPGRTISDNGEMGTIFFEINR